MTPGRWREIEKLFNELVGHGVAEQAAALEAVEPELRREVEKLLANDGLTNATAVAAVREAAACLGGSPSDPGTEFPNPASTLAAGRHLGPYEILSLIGVGGMGEVYKALDTRLKRTVAIKVLPAHFRKISK